MWLNGLFIVLREGWFHDRGRIQLMESDLIANCWSVLYTKNSSSVSEDKFLLCKSVVK